MSDVFRSAPSAGPASPREVTPDIDADSAVHGRFLRLFGGIWAGIALGLCLFFSLGVLAFGQLGTAWWAGAPTALFAVAGAALWAIGRWQRASALRVFREGIEVAADVVDVFQDHRVRMNGRHPWRVVYAFVAGGKPVRGTATFWDEAPPRVAKGDRVAVLHAPGKPSRSVLWTRLDRGDAAPRARIAEVPEQADSAVEDSGDDDQRAERRSHRAG